MATLTAPATGIAHVSSVYMEDISGFGYRNTMPASEFPSYTVSETSEWAARIISVECADTCPCAKL